MNTVVVGFKVGEPVVHFAQALSTGACTIRLGRHGLKAAPLAQLL